MLLLFFSVFFIFTHTTYSFKNKIILTLGIKNTSAFQYEITKKVHRYYKIFDQNKSINELYSSIWNPSFDPFDPDKGWGTRIHQTIYPLSEKNVDILPKGARGYLMDSTCNADVWNDNSYSFTIINVPSDFIEENDTIEVSVFCFVSENFNGDWACIALSINEVPWVGSAFYDMKDKGTWQKLTIAKEVSSGSISFYLYFAKTGDSSFSNLKGHVIFAYPNYKNLSIIKDIPISQEASIYQSSQEKIKDISLNMLHESFFCLGIYTIFEKLNDSEKDPIRNLASKLISEDTVYYPYKSNLNIANQSEIRGDNRIMLWKFALKIWINEYNLTQKILGGGFAFLNWYGFYFASDKNKTGHPHNPFLNILLYSGIIGVLLYIFLLYKVFYYYIKYIKEYYLFFIFFLITYFFTFFSGGNPFDPPIMGFFMMLPFFIHYIHEKDKPVVEKQKFKLRVQSLLYKIKNFRINS